MDLARCHLHTLGDAEKAKLDALRECLPKALASGRDQSEELKAKDKLTLWKANLEVQDDASDIVLLKYLRAEELDVQKAAERIKATMVFRADCCVDGLKDAEMPDHFLGHDFVTGCDADGRPIMISRFGGMDIEKVFGDAEAFIRYRTKVMEQAIDLLTFKKGAAEDLCQVHDYSGVMTSMFNSDVKNGVTAISKIFGEHYPEFKGKTLFVNFPAVFSKPFKAMCALLPERTRKKFAILGQDDFEALFEHVSPDLCPVVLGGLFQEPKSKLTVPGQCVVVKARDAADILLCRVDAPAKIAWELRVCSYEVAFEVVFIPDGGEECEIQKNKAGEYLKVEDGVVSGEWSANAAGEVRCRLRNECAWFKRRVCTCRAGPVS